MAGICVNWNIQNAFLNGVLEEDVFIRQPLGYVDPARPHHLCRLHKAIYGLKQALRAWHTWLSSILHTLGFHSSTAGTSLFIYRCPKVTVYLLVYVDDIIAVSSSPSAPDKLIIDLRSEFAVKDLGSLHFSLVLRSSVSLMVCFSHNGNMRPSCFAVLACLSANLLTPLWLLLICSHVLMVILYLQTKQLQTATLLAAYSTLLLPAMIYHM